MATNGEILRVDVRYTALNASQALNVFYWRMMRTISDTLVLDSIENWIRNEWGPDWRALAPDTSRIVDFTAVVVDNTGKLVREVGGRVIGISGQHLHEVKPAAVSGFLLTGTTRPKSRVKKYVPFVSESVVNNGKFNAEAAAKLLLLATHVLKYLMDGPDPIAEPGTLSRVVNAFLQAIPMVYFTDVPAYQRRRKPNVGS